MSVRGRSFRCASKNEDSSWTPGPYLNSLLPRCNRLPALPSKFKTPAPSPAPTSSPPPPIANSRPRHSQRLGLLLFPRSRPLCALSTGSGHRLFHRHLLARVSLLSSLVIFLFVIYARLVPEFSTCFAAGPKDWLKEQKKKSFRFLLAPIDASRQSLRTAYLLLSITQTHTLSASLWTRMCSRMSLSWRLISFGFLQRVVILTKPIRIWRKWRAYWALQLGIAFQETGIPSFHFKPIQESRSYSVFFPNLIESNLLY